MSTPSPGGIFIWYELMTTDSAAALQFYSRVLGWTAVPNDMNDIPYTLVSAGGFHAGGIMTLPKDACDAGAQPAWVGYIGVADVDAHVEKLKAAGGSVLRAPADIPGVGRFAVVADPHGAVFQMMTPISSGPMPNIPANAPGHVGWRELHAGNGPEAFAFYSSLFGWKPTMAVDMGPMGVYQTFSTGGVGAAGASGAEAEAVGGMMTRVPQMPVACWMYYFNVDGIDAAVARAAEAGGKLVMGPHQVPGDQWIAQCMDPQGAMFAMLSLKR